MNHKNPKRGSNGKKEQRKKGKNGGGRWDGEKGREKG